MARKKVNDITPSLIKNAIEGFQSAKDVRGIQDAGISELGAGNIYSTKYNEEQKSKLVKKILIREWNNLKILRESFKQQEEIIFKSVGGKKKFIQRLEEWTKIFNYDELTRAEGLLTELMEKIKPLDRASLIQLLESVINELEPEEMLDIIGFDTDNFLGLGNNKIINKEMVYNPKDKDGYFGIGYTISEDFDKNAFKELLENFRQINKKKGQISVIVNKNKIEVRVLKNVKINTQRNLERTITAAVKRKNTDFTIIRSDTYVKQLQDIVNTIINAWSGLSISDGVVKSNVINKLTEIIGEEGNGFFGIEQFDFNRSKALIKGSLAEIYWTVFFNYLGIKAIPAGLKFTDINNLQTPTDIILHLKDKGLFNIQVKNFQKEGGKVYFHGYHGDDGKPTAGTSTFGQLFSHLENENLGEKMGQVFFSQTYNLPTSNEIYQDKNFEKYKNLYSRFDFIIKGFESYLMGNLPKLLNFDRDITPSDLTREVLEQYGEENLGNLGQPTIFLIGDKILTSSDMVNTIMKLLKGTSKNDEKALQGAYIKIEQISFFYLNTKVDPWPASGSYNDSIFNKGRVKYIIEVNLDDLYDSIISKFEKNPT